MRRVAAVAAVAASLFVPVSDGRAGFDGQALDRELRAQPGVLAVLVERDGRLLFEHYYNGSAAAARLDTFSVTKSITSTLIGVAMAHRRLRDLDQRLGEFFPRLVAAAPDRRVRQISLRELLTMKAGYVDTPAARSDDWIRTYIDRPLAAAPGTRFAYDNGSYHLLSAILTQTTRQTAATYGGIVLFRPLGIRDIRWDSDGQGHSLGNTGLYLRARDLLRIGELYLHHGRWHGRRILPRAYIVAATRSYSSANYGYGWWILRYRGLSGYLARGYGGQVIAVLPGPHLVIVLTGSGSDARHILFDIVLPSLKLA